MVNFLENKLNFHRFKSKYDRQSFKIPQFVKYEQFIKK